MTAILRLTDGTTYIDLLHNEGQGGYFLADGGWKPAVAGYKDGGTYQDSPLADGKRLVQAVRDNAIESFTLELKGHSQDETIRWTQDLRRLLDKAQRYWTGATQNEPVYLEVKAATETNTRYAIVIQGTMANDDNPMGMPFLQPNCQAAMQSLTLVVERGEWCANPPGVSTCQYIDTSHVQEGGFQILTANAFTDHAVWDAVAIGPTGILYALDLSNRLYDSTDNGATWNLKSTTPTTDIGGVTYTNFMCSLGVAANGDVYIGGYITAAGVEANEGAAIWKSTNGGTTVTLTDNVPDATQGYPYKIIPITSQIILTFIQLTSAGTVVVRKTINAGGAWSTAQTFQGTFGDAILLVGGLLVATAGLGPPYYSLDQGATWLRSGNGAGYDYLVEWPALGGGTIIAASGFTFYISTNYGYTWAVLSTEGTNRVYGLVLGSDNKLYAFCQTGLASVYSSTDGITWQPECYTFASDDGYGHWLQPVPATGSVLLGIDHDVYDLAGTATTGSTRSCDDSHYVANKSNTGQITHAYANSGATYTAVYPKTTFPFDLFPAVPAVNDILYIGSTAGPFCSVVFDLASRMVSGSHTIVWEYYHSAAWVTLTVQDNTNSFMTLGNQSVSWVQPDDWITVAVNGVTAYWVRAKISAGVGLTDSPSQQHQNIYSVLWSYVNIDDADVVGDLAALAKMEVTVVSDEDGVGGSGPDLYLNRVICGLRSYDRGANFCAILNASNTQLLPMVTVAEGANTTFHTGHSQCATGRECIYDPPAAADAMAARCTWTLASTVARDYYGTFHAFMRGQQEGGTSGDIAVRLVVSTGSGGVSWTSETLTFAVTSANQLLDFGRMTLPVSSLFLSTEIADETTLTIEASNSLAAGTSLLHIHDLILIPTDEWAGDFTDTVNTASSAVINERLLAVDSVGNPRQAIAAKVKSALLSTSVVAIWQAVANGPLALQPYKAQRLWFLTARTATAGSSDWRSEPYVLSKVQLYKNERYFSARGNR